MKRKIIALMTVFVVLSTGMHVFANSDADNKIQEKDSRIIELESELDYMEKLLITHGIQIDNQQEGDGRAEKADAPDEICYRGKRLSYHDTMISDTFLNAGVYFSRNDENEIRCISFNNPDIKTYKNISVGDSIDTVISTFDYEEKITNYSYIVMFSENEEIKTITESNEESAVLIEYFCQDKIITKIRIFDSKFAREKR